MATTTPKKWRVFHKTLGELSITAERYVKTGSGTYFYDADGNDAGSFGDQEVGTVLPADVKGSDEA